MRRKQLALAAAAILLAATPAAAQRQDTTCTYRVCALRVEPRGLGTSLVRGAEGTVVARVGLLGVRPSLVELVAQSDTAAAYAAEYQRLAPRGAVFTFAAPLLLLIPAVHQELGEGPTIAVSAAALGASLYGTAVVLRAQRALARSIWWYNASFMR